VNNTSGSPVEVYLDLANNGEAGETTVTVDGHVMPGHIRLPNSSSDAIVFTVKTGGSWSVASPPAWALVYTQHTL
jgi:hypothetical protein